MAIEQLVIVIDTPPTDELRSQCQAIGATLVRRGSPLGGRTGAMVAGTPKASVVHSALEHPFSGFLELSPDGIAGVGCRCFDSVRAGGFALSLTTAAAYAIDVTDLVAAAIRRRFPAYRGPEGEMIELCLAEAISNAVIHGNLGIDNSLRATREGFELFRQTLSARLREPQLACRRVEVTAFRTPTGALSISVGDQGRGYDMARQLVRPVAPEAKCGRGLALIRKVTQSVLGEDDGRTLVMIF
jgi:anti-sigma regulatory factor (Ser/Thr protein kinase)